MDELTNEDLEKVLEGLLTKSAQMQQRLGAQLDPITFVSAQVHVLIAELWPDQRDRTIFGIKVHQEIVDRLEEVGTEIRKQQLVQGVGMAPPQGVPGMQTPRNRAEQRRQQRGR